MESFLYFLLTLMIAGIGGLIGRKLKLPAGVMLGAMIVTVTFNLLTQKAVFYPDVRIALQVLAGAMIGSRMDRTVILGIKRLIVPIILLVTSMFVLNLVFGLLIYLSSPLDAATALFAAAPGGASDMAIIAEDLGAAPEYVAILQLSRLIIIFSFMPMTVKKLMQKQQAKEGIETALEASDRSEQETAVTSDNELPKEKSQAWNTRLLQLICSAAIGGMAFYFLGVTAGAMIGGMIGGTIYCVLKGKVAFPSKLKLFMQVGSGAFIGLKVEREMLMSLDDLIIPLLIMFVGIFVFAFATAFIMNKMTKLDFITCLLASTPGGQQEMALLSEELDADTPSIAIMQTARLVCVIAFFPTLIELVLLLS